MENGFVYNPKLTSLTLSLFHFVFHIQSAIHSGTHGAVFKGGGFQYFQQQRIATKTDIDERANSSVIEFA